MSRTQFNSYLRPAEPIQGGLLHFYFAMYQQIHFVARNEPFLVSESIPRISKEELK